jgi:RHS repeat-associated protein
MLLPNRHESSSEYRYGFQGQEKDDEIKGEGNSYTAEYWQYDSRLGRRWNVDPVVKHHESPYAAFANSPIWIIDPNGADSVLFNNLSGEELGRGVTPEKDKTAIWQVDVDSELYDENNPWKTATPLTYTVGEDQDCKCVKGTKLRDEHPLSNKDWVFGD